MRKNFAQVLIAALLVLVWAVPIALAEVATEGYEIRGNELNVRLWAAPKAEIQWMYEINDDYVLDCTSENVPVGDSQLRAWTFAPKGDGESFVTFYYEDLENPEAGMRMLCYIVTVQGGEITDVVFEDMSGEEALDGDEEGVILYAGETGGMDLMIPDDMTSQETPEGTLLTAKDGTMTMLVSYQRDENPAELFEQLKDEAHAKAVFDGEGEVVLYSFADKEADPPVATMLMSTAEGFEEYSGYMVPDGGVLHVRTTYIMEDMDMDMDEWGDDFFDEELEE